MALNDEDFMTIEQLGDKFPQDWISVKGLWPYIKRLGMDLDELIPGAWAAFGAKLKAVLQQDVPHGAFANLLKP